MKQYVDQKGNSVKFGEMVHYEESVSKKDYKSFYEVHVTLTPENVEKLKAIGAIKEIEVHNSLKHYDERLKELLHLDEKGDSIKRFKYLFPSQYLSAVITLINDDVDDDSNIKDSGFIFNLGSGEFEKIKIDKPLNYINVFSSEQTRDMCLDIIKPWVDKMYK